MRKKMNLCFNVIKIVAALSVFLLHFSGSLKSRGIFAPVFLWTPAWTAVWVFFILSGYFAGKGFWSGKYHTDSVRDIINFYLQRSVSILPLCWFIIFLDIAFVNSDIYFQQPSKILHVLIFQNCNNTMIGNLWYIGTLFQLYFFAPIIYILLFSHLKKISNVFMRKCFVLAILGTMIISGGGLRVLLDRNGTNFFAITFCNVFTNMDLFFVPFLLSCFSINSKDSLLKKNLRYLTVSAFLFFFAVNTYLMKCWWFNYAYGPFVQLYCPTITLSLMSAMLYAFDVPSFYISKEAIFAEKNAFKKILIQGTFFLSNIS